MDKSQLEQFRNLFKELERNAKIELAEVLALDEAHRGDEVDRSQSDSNNSLSLKLISRNRHYQQKIKESLQRIEAGNFGECQDCGCEISLQRLYARPTAELCIQCKEEQEGQESMIRYEKRSHSNGKTLVSSENVLAFQNFDEDTSGTKRVLKFQQIH